MMFCFVFRNNPIKDASDAIRAAYEARASEPSGEMKIDQLMENPNASEVIGSPRVTTPGDLREKTDRELLYTSTLLRAREFSSGLRRRNIYFSC